MTALANIADQFLYADFSVIPVRADKKPALAAWAQYQQVPMDEETAAKAFEKAGGIAVICGRVSNGLECIDFDAHDKDIERIFSEWSREDGIRNIIDRNNLYIERSPRGGYHVFYRYETDVYQGSQKLANWTGGESMIETKGEGGYVIVAPSPGYVVMKNDLVNLHKITLEERDYLISFARSFNQDQRRQEAEQQSETQPSGYDHTDPVSWFNWHKGIAAKALLKDAGWTMVNRDEKQDIESWRRPGKSDGVSATWGKKHNALYVFSSSAAPFKPGCYYTPFQIMVILRFKGDHFSALHWVQSKYFDDEIPYVRVGTDYYKKIRKSDRYGIERVELKVWKKEEIKQDKGKAYINNIPRFDDFTIEPNNLHYRPVIQNCYNLYKEFSHKPAPGEWHWIELLIRHVFGEQFALGIRYMQALYLYPDRLLPILALVSSERQTGKTTFLNFLNIIFGENMVNIQAEDLVNSFNFIYATSNIIAIEETLIEKAISNEKLKALATGKFLSVNQKFVNQFKIPFFGKIIMASNNEDKFTRIDQEEIRYFVRKLGRPTVINHAIESDMVAEIPAFLYYLTTLPPIDWSRDRSGFTPDELENDTLRRVKDESRSGLYKDLFELIADWFANSEQTTLEVTAIDIKDRWFKNNSRIDISYIRRVIKAEFGITSGKVRKYTPFWESKTEFTYNIKTGAAFIFESKNFI